LDKNLAKVVGMARPGEETLVADSTTLLVGLLESVLLDIADSLHGNTNDESDDANNISGFVEGRLWVSIDNGTVQHGHRHADCPDLNIGIISHVR
jgi:hypothetical protein